MTCGRKVALTSTICPIFLTADWVILSALRPTCLHLLAVPDPLLGLRNELMQEVIFLLGGPGQQMVLFDRLEELFRLLFPDFDRFQTFLFHQAAINALRHSTPNPGLVRVADGWLLHGRVG